jgi:hypothetical protein
VATLPQDTFPSRWVAPALVLAAVVLVPWTLLLAYSLPARHTSDHWDVAWVGFDIALAASLAATGWGIARHAVWVQSAAAVAATLLLCDAWFDNVLASGYGEHLEAALEAIFVEIPLALFCVWLAHHCEHAVDAVLRAVGVRPGRRAADAASVSAADPRAREQRSRPEADRSASRT